jgi:hypothetical protein
MTQNVWLYASNHHIPLGTQPPTIKHTQSSKLDKLNTQHPVHYKITSLDSAIIWVVVSEVGHSRHSDVPCAVGYEICMGLF